METCNQFDLLDSSAHVTHDRSLARNVLTMGTAPRLEANLLREYAHFTGVDSRHARKGVVQREETSVSTSRGELYRLVRKNVGTGVSAEMQLNMRAYWLSVAEHRMEGQGKFNKVCTLRNTSTPPLTRGPLTFQCA